MEQSRFLFSSKLYITGMCCLLLGIILLGITLYLLPVVFFEFSENLPTSIFRLIGWVHSHWGYDSEKVMRIFWISVFLIGIALFVCADFCSNLIDRQLLRAGKKLRHAEKNMIDIRLLLLILISLTALVLLVAKIVDRIFFSSFPIT
jgi:hypothetical protein